MNPPLPLPYMPMVDAFIQPQHTESGITPTYAENLSTNGFSRCLTCGELLSFESEGQILPSQISRDNVAIIPTLSPASSKHAISFLLNDTEVFPLAVAPAFTITAPGLASSSSATPQSPVHSIPVATTSATATSASSSSIVAPSHGKVVHQELKVKHDLIGPYPGMGLFDPYERLLVPVSRRRRRQVKRWKPKPVRNSADGH